MCCLFVCFLYCVVFVSGNKITIENLKPSTTYRLKVRAKNDVGVGGQLEQTVITESIRKLS